MPCKHNNIIFLIYKTNISTPNIHTIQFFILTEVPRILYSLLSVPINAQHIYSNNILYIISTATCSSASAYSSACLNLVLATVTKLLKLQLDKSRRLKCSDDRCCMIKSIKC